MCVTIGAYLLMTSNILWDGKISYVRLGFASFFLGYAVGCGIFCLSPRDISSSGILFRRARTSASPSRSGNDNRVNCTRIAAVITAAAMVFSVHLTFTNLQKGWSTTHYSFTSQEGDQITKELVDAFEHHQVNLLEEPDEDLLKMDNPYEYTRRDDL